MIKTIIFTVKVLLTVISAIVLFALVFYCQTHVFDFPETSKFSGGSYYNPYESVSGSTLKANFHAHTAAYGGVTNGDDGYTELKDFYKKRGIDVPVISNYFSTSSEDKIKAYEHGINISKTHKLAINPAEELYFDYPFFQTTSQKQDIIERLKTKNALVVVAHPNMREGHTEFDMTKLVGYHFTEIRSCYANAEKYWDAALKQGRLSWLMINDDSHGIVKQLPGRYYNVVFTNNEDGILDSLQSGKHYGIAQKTEFTDLALNNIKMTGDILNYEIIGDVNKVTLIADGIKVDSLTKGNGSFKFPEYASYVRLVADSEHCTLYTNPITRQKTASTFASVSGLKPKVEILKTILARAFFVICFVVLLSAIVKMWAPRYVSIRKLVILRRINS